MPRERTTWNRDEIAKRASHSKSADPYLMNQDHVKGQPSADKYVTGDPSTFAEDPHPSAGTWKAEYSGGQVKRDEIGMPEYRKDTFNHPEKTASEASLIAKASLAVAVSRAMLPKTASESSVEAQATSLMHLPDVELASTYKRLVAEQEQDDDDEGQEKQAQGQDQQGQDQEKDKQAGELPPALKKFNEEKKDKAEGKSDKDDKDQGDKEAAQDQGQQDQGQKQAQQDQVAALQQQLASMQQQVASLLQQAQQVNQGQQPQVLMAQDQQGQDQQDQGQKQAQQDQGQKDQGQEKQAQAARIQKAMADAIAAGQDPVKAASEAIQSCQGPMLSQQTDAQLIDQMLAQQEPVMSDMGIQLDTPVMDMGEMSMTADDAVLNQLFASQESEDAQQAQQGQDKQAHAVRTAATRTVGTRPTAGVSQLGGLPSAGKKDDVSSLSSMWNSAPDVSAAFGITGR